MNEERPIEKLLRRAAEKRNAEAGTPPELHPANRRMLQAEVAKQFPQPGPPAVGPGRSFWLLLSQRWSFAVGIFVVLAIAAFAFWPMLSKNKTHDQLSKLASEDETVMSGAALPEAVMPASQPVAPVAFDMEAGQATLSGGGNLAVVSPSATPAPTGTTEYFTRTAAADNVTRSLATEPAIQAPPQPLLRTSRTQEPVARSVAFGADRLNVESDSRPAAPERRMAEREVGTRNRTATAPTVIAEEKTTQISDAEAATERIAPTQTRGPEPQPPATVAVRSDAVADRLELGFASGESVSNRLAGGGERQEQFFAGRIESSNQPAVTDAVVTDAGAFADQSGLARGGGEENRSAVANSQLFSNVDLKAAALAKKEAGAISPPPVLVNFKVEQAGQFLRVIDGDGSVYRGYVDEANTLYKQVVAQKEKAVALDNRLKVQSPRDASANNVLPQQTPELFLYRVEGTNRSLNQNVVFSWNFTPTNEALAAAQKIYNNNLLNSTPAELPSQFPELLQNSFINGRAQLGESRQYEINAVPVKP